jgi:hypothetical protein
MERRPTSRAITKGKGALSCARSACEAVPNYGLRVCILLCPRQFRRKALRGSYGGSTVYGRCSVRTLSMREGRMAVGRSQSDCDELESLSYA